MTQLEERRRLWKTARGAFPALAADALLSPAETRLARRIRRLAPEIREEGEAIDAETSLEARRERAFATFARLFELGLHRLKADRPVPIHTRLVLLEELARADAGIGIGLVATWQGGETLTALAGQGIGAAYAKAFRADLSGRWLVASGLTEPGMGSDTIDFERDRSLATQARPVRGGFVLDGRKWMVGNAGAARLHLVVAQRRGARGFKGRLIALIPEGTGGFSVELLGKRGLRSATFGELALDGAFVPSNLTFTPPSAPKDVLRPFQHAALASLVAECAALAVGVGQAAVELAAGYAGLRHQGGTAIARHQAVALRLAEARGGVDAARSAIRALCRQWERGQPRLAEAAEARALCVEAARRACAIATDVMGSPAITEAGPVDKLARDVETLAVVPGTIDFLRLLASPALEG